MIIVNGNYDNKEKVFRASSNPFKLFLTIWRNKSNRSPTVVMKRLSLKFEFVVILLLNTLRLLQLKDPVGHNVAWKSVNWNGKEDV